MANNTISLHEDLHAKIAKLRAERDAARTKAIEECAKVADGVATSEDYEWYGTLAAESIAASIRELK